ncbi:MAG: hypothetical protein WAV45_06400 [Propionibacteriaceae bacterium]
MGLWRESKRVLAVLLVSGLLVGCTFSPPPSTPQPSKAGAPLSVAGDPEPTTGPAQPAGPEGGRYTTQAVTVDVPKGAVPDGRQFHVSIGAPIGEFAGVVTREAFGAPVSIEHDIDLLAPVLISWDVTALSSVQRASMMLVRWDEPLGVWTPSDEPITLTGNTASTQVRQFSIVDWISSGAAVITQAVGQAAGKRADAPICSNATLPTWVGDVVRPDADQPAMPIRTCVEPDKNEVLTVRVANNRPYTQTLDLHDGAKYAWTWAGEPDYTVAGIIRDGVNGVLSTSTSLVMAPTRSTAVGLSQPASAGSVRLTLGAHPTIATVTEDLIVMILEDGLGLDNVQGFDSKALNAFVQTVYSCGGKEVLKSRDIISADLVVKVIETIKTCAGPDQINPALDAALKAAKSQGGDTAAAAVKTNRLLKETTRILSLYLTTADIASYTAELASSAALGDTKLTVYGTGTPPSLGSWTPTCTDADADSTALYKNLAQQESYFTHQSQELADLPSWKPDALKAVQPIQKCSATQMEAIAENVETTWADTKAAAVVATAVRDLAPQPPGIILSGRGIGKYQFGAREADVLKLLTGALGEPKIQGQVGGCEEASFGYQNYVDFGSLTVRFAAQDNSAASPRTMQSWEVRASKAPTGSVKLDPKIPFGLTLAQIQAKYPGSSGLENVGAVSAEGVLLIPAEKPGAEVTVHAGGLDWCI